MDRIGCETRLGSLSVICWVAGDTTVRLINLPVRTSVRTTDVTLRPSADAKEAIAVILSPIIKHFANILKDATQNSATLLNVIIGACSVRPA